MKIKEDERLNNPQKAKRALAYLRNRRFPLLNHAEKVFQTMVSKLNLPDKVKISHPPFFENPDYHLEIQFRNGKKLGDTVKKLAQLKDLESIGDPWEEIP